ncbi:MAG: hypothetical protein QNJ31_09535 [Candidatus Caenarcaniphilales bacterium]|nr:hypothetical protein [Candidatus Caenarcaniphilales bacterium]
MQVHNTKSHKTLKVYTTPSVDAQKYNVLNDTLRNEAEKSPEKLVSGAMAAAFAREVAGGRSMSKEEYINSMYSDKDWNQLSGKGNSCLPPGAFPNINGRFKNDPKIRKALEHELIEEKFDEFQANLPENKLTRLKELIRTAFDESEREAIIKSHQQSEPSIVELLKLEENANNSPEDKERFDEALNKERQLVISQADPILQNLLCQIGPMRLAEDPSNIWTAVLRNLHEQDLLQPPHEWTVTDENLDNISWITRKHFESLAAQTERPKPLGAYRQTKTSDSQITHERLIYEINQLTPEEQAKVIFSPKEIVETTKPFFASYKEDGFIKGNSLQYDADQNKYHESQAELIEEQISQILSKKTLDSNDELELKELKTQKNHHKAEARRYENSFLEKIEPNSGWQEDGTKIIPGDEGVIFVNQDGNEVTDPAELDGLILKREIQALIKPQNRKKMFAFVSGARDYLSNQGFSREEIEPFLDAYSRSLHYFGKGLKITNSRNKEETLGGHSQISFAARRIVNLSYGSPTAADLFKCIELISGKIDSMKRDIHNQLLRLLPKDLRELKRSFHQRTGVNMLDIKPGIAVFGEDGIEYAPRQSHTKQEKRIVEREITIDDQIRKVQRSLTIIRDIPELFFEPSSEDTCDRRRQTNLLKEQTGGNPMNHFFGRVSAVKEFYEWAMANPRPASPHYNKLKEHFGTEKIKKFLDDIFDPLGASDYWSTSILRHYFAKNRIVDELPQTSENITVLSKGRIEVRDDQMLYTNSQSDYGIEFIDSKASKRAIDEFIGPAFAEMKEIGYVAPKPREEDNALSQTLKLLEMYNSMEKDVAKSINEEKNRLGRRLTKEEMQSIRFKIFIEAELKSQFNQKRYLIVSESGASKINPKEKNIIALNKELKKTKDLNVTREVLKLLEKYVNLSRETQISDFTDSNDVILLQVCFGNPKYFGNLAKYLQTLTKIQIQAIVNFEKS